jgi:hypothetical protein
MSASQRRTASDEFDMSVDLFTWARGGTPPPLLARAISKYRSLRHKLGDKTESVVQDGLGGSRIRVCRPTSELIFPSNKICKTEKSSKKLFSLITP